MSVALSNEPLLRDSCLEARTSRLVARDPWLETRYSRLATRTPILQGPVMYDIVLRCFIPFAAFVTS